MSEIKYIAEWSSRSGIKGEKFLTSLRGYMWKRITNLPIDWGWAGRIVQSSKFKVQRSKIIDCGYWAVDFLLIGALVASIGSGYYSSPTLAGETDAKLVEKVSRAGDYELARRLLVEFENKNIEYGSKVLGINTELGDLVYPERSVNREIKRVLEKLEKYPTSLDLLLYESRLYEELGEREQGKIYWEQARELDPNNKIFSENLGN